MTRILTMLLLCAVVALSCGDERDGMPDIIDHERSLPGTWIYVEYGYSPGAGYYTRPASMEPPKTMVLGADGSVATTLTELERFTRYRVETDANSGSELITFTTDDEASGSTRTYAIAWEEKKLLLYFLGCIEGCHIGFVKTARPAED